MPYIINSFLTITNFYNIMRCNSKPESTVFFLHYSCYNRIFYRFNWNAFFKSTIIITVQAVFCTCYNPDSAGIITIKLIYNKSIIIWNLIKKDRIFNYMMENCRNTRSSSNPYVSIFIFTKGSYRIIYKSIFYTVLFYNTIALKTDYTFIICTNPNILICILNDCSRTQKIVILIIKTIHGDKFHTIKAQKTAISTKVHITIAVLNFICYCICR